MPKHPRRLRSKHRRGTSMIEMAIILPVLILLVVACIDFGRFGYWYVSVTNAAREGAWYATVFPIDVSTKQDDIARVCAQEMGIDAATMPSGWVTAERISGTDRVRVTVQYPFDMLIRWPAFARTYTIARRVEMRVIQ